MLWQRGDRRGGQGTIGLVSKGVCSGIGTRIRFIHTYRHIDTLDAPTEEGGREEWS